MNNNKPTRSVKRPRLLFVAQDVGGFNAVWPVFGALRTREDVRGIFGPLNKAQARGKGVVILDSKSRQASATVKKIIQAWKPTCVVLGTSGGLSLDKIAIREASRHGIPTISIVDYWGNEHARFSTPGTKDRAFCPDWVLVPDNACRRGMSRTGFDTRHVVVTGNPHFDQFSRARKPARRAKADKQITFLSQPFSELKIQFRETDPGYDERDVLRDVLSALRGIGKRVEVTVVFHPRERLRHKFDSIIAESGIAVRVERKKRAADVMGRSLFVVGMNTMALVEAALSGIPAVSYQPNSKKRDRFVPNRLGLTRAAYSKKMLSLHMKRLLESGGDRPHVSASMLADGQATRRVLAFLRLHWL